MKFTFLPPVQFNNCVLPPPPPPPPPPPRLAAVVLCFSRISLGKRISFQSHRFSFSLSLFFFSSSLFCFSPFCSLLSAFLLQRKERKDPSQELIRDLAKLDDGFPLFSRLLSVAERERERQREREKRPVTPY